jgi:hypothetical protein
MLALPLTALLISVSLSQEASAKPRAAIPGTPLVLEVDGRDTTLRAIS